MSNQIATDPDPHPDPVSSRTDPPSDAAGQPDTATTGQPDTTATGQPDTTTTDPLLQNGSYIDPSINPSTGEQTSNNPQNDEEKQPPPPQSSTPANGAATQTPPKSRRKVPVTVSPGGIETPSWLPPGWVIQDRVRTSGATAGVVDKYYIEPLSGRRFRSKKEVQYYLETGSLKKKRKNDAENPEADANAESSGKPNKKKAKRPVKKFNHLKVPDCVEWVLTDADEDIWTPFIGGSMVPDYERQGWEFEMLQRQQRHQQRR